MTLPHIIFMSAWISSFFTSSYGLIKFFKNGPFSFLPEDGGLAGYLTIETLSCFFSILSLTVTRFLLLGYMVRDRPVLKLLKAACNFAPNVGEHCSQVSVIFLAHGFRTRIFNLTDRSATMDQYISDDIHSSNILSWDKISATWYENDVNLPSFKTVLCGNWDKKSVTGLECLLWILLNCVPHLLFAIIVLIVNSNVNQAISVIKTFPQIILSSAYTTFGFSINSDNEVSFSVSVTLINCILTIIGYIISLAIIWDTIQIFPNSHRDQNLIILFMPVTLAFYLYHLIFLLYLQASKAEHKGSYMQWFLCFLPLAVAILYWSLGMSLFHRD